jgi:hypothetical protein
MTTGRPTGLTEEIVKAVQDMADRGQHPELMPPALGVPERTFRHWLKLGANARRTGEAGGDASIYARLLAAIQQGEEKFERQLRDTVLLLAKNNWQAALTVLERRFPKRWGKVVAVRPSEQAAVEVVVDALKRGDEDVALAIRQALEEMAADESLEQ